MSNAVNVSGTYNFDPSLGEMTLYAYNLVGIRNTAILQEHMQAARMAANMLLGRWSSQGVNLWMVTLQSIPLVQGQSTYNVPNNNITMLDTYIVTSGVTFTGSISGTTLTVTDTTGGAPAVGMALSGNSLINGTQIVSGSGSTWTVNNSQTVASGSITGETAQSINRLILPISRTEYASYPNKEQQGFPTTYWQDRLINGNVSLWPVPDGTQTALNFYQVCQIDDAGFTNGMQVNMPNYFYEAFVYGLAQRLAMIWAPERVGMLKPLADEAYMIAVEQNVENSDFYLTPQISGYFR
jgi:hypothetical protein